MLEHLGEHDAAAAHRHGRARLSTATPPPLATTVTSRRRRHRRKVVDAHHPHEEDLDGRRARRLGQRDRSTSSATRLHYGTGAFEGIRAYTTPPGRGGLPPARAHRAPASRCKIFMIDVPYSARRARARRPRDGRAGERAERRLLHPTPRLPRLRRDGPQPAALPGQRLDRRVAVGRLPRRRRRGQRRAHEDQLVGPPRPQRDAHGRQGDRACTSTPRSPRSRRSRPATTRRSCSAPTGGSRECTGENIFIVRDGVLVTPPPRRRAPSTGITQARSIEDRPATSATRCASRRSSATDLYLADEAFLTGTAAEVVPIRSVDDRLGRRRQARARSPVRIQETYFPTVRGEVDRYKDWLDHVD